ncbi:DUF5916 domain-containing protein [Pseudoalteromonas sp. MMG012]|uniref:DUF5916 domain-containing protein n=1 Tax=Pseudoalteromonas sp. MMG012 TaxID=2822686 RepID=UPI001B3A61A8|nr:DUF5916 domain-containing protein [Pseudoalteromonas sp. MMG012]MBQ4852778.1 hypothetical protein [Pseudoalteromonas sp. MMG012]
MSGVLRNIYVLILGLMSTLVCAKDNVSIVLDGQLIDQAWQDASATKTFYEVVPATHTEYLDKVESKVVTTAQGVYVGIINWQKEGERKKQFNLQDGFIQADFNRIYLDFSGDGSGAYLFVVGLGGGVQDAVLTPQLTTDSDWDGDWQTSYFEAADYWSSETFIPWHTVSFYNKKNLRDASEIGVSVQLYQLVNNHLYASQKQTTANADFFLTMPKVKAIIPQEHQVTFVPYITRQQDLIDNIGLNDIGFDLIYKPDHHQKLSVAINPDFGQIDSDEVDLNYSAVETLRSDKRAFFTQDINVFNVQSLQDTTLIHTRRIGASSDDMMHITTPIDAAVRFVQQTEQLQFGAFAVKEDKLGNDVGKSFYAIRGKYRHKAWQTGLLMTHTERPFIERDARSIAWDTQYQSATWSMQSTMMHSDIAQSQTSQQGRGASLKLGYQFSANTQFESSYLQLDEKFDVSDLGYIKRNDWRYWQGEFSHAINFNSPLVTSVKQKIAVAYESNDERIKLPAQRQYSANVMLNGGAEASATLTHNSSGWQDNVGYNSDRFQQPDTWGSRVFYRSSYVGKFSWAASYQYDQEGLNGIAQQFALDLTFMPHENWNININNFYRKGDGWLIANSHNQLTQYDRAYFVNENKVTGLLTDDLELSIYLQWAVLEAKSEQVFSITDGSLTELTNLDTSFEDKRLVSQMKLRYRLGAFSDIYLVYGRGATQIDNMQKQNVAAEPWSRSVERLWQTPNEERIILKFRYGF